MKQAILKSIEIKFNYTNVILLFLMIAASSCSRAEFEVTEVAQGVYLHSGVHQQITAENKGDIANIGFIIGDEAVAVIDTGTSKMVGDALKQSIREITDLPIRYVILTHGHPDHIFGVSAFINETDNAELAGHKNLARILAMRGDFYRQRFIESAGFNEADMQLAEQTLFVVDEMTLDLGSREIILKAFDVAHTDNDVAVYDKKTKTIWTGDLLFRERVPVIDGSIRGWFRVLEQLALYDVSTIVPGHGSVADEWQQATNNQLSYFHKIVSQVKNNLDKGVSLQKSVNSVATDEADNWLLFEDHHGQNVSRTYTELEWE